MDQVVNEGPLNPLGSYALSREALRFRTMGIHEHAALVQAIMTNFPEIYEKPVNPEFDHQSGGHCASGPPGQLSAQV
jgi:hypothetical protein